MKDPKLQIRKEIEELYDECSFIHNYITFIEDMFATQAVEKFKKHKKYLEVENKSFWISSRYQKWYSIASATVKQLLPERLEEFKRLYLIEKRDKKITNLTYTISDYLLGIKVQVDYGEQKVNGALACVNKIEQQLGIIESCLDALSSKLYNIESVLQSELFDDELGTAKSILKKGHVRVAGTLAGITLESHLKKVSQSHSIKFTKQHPTISEYNDELRKSDVIDVPTWRLIQRLGDIRNLSVHAKDRDPKPSEVEDLIIGTEKLIAELF